MSHRAPALTVGSNGTCDRRALHLGITPWRTEGAGSASELVAQARLAEEWGYDSFWLPESHFHGGSRPQPLLQLATLAGATERIRLGTTSLLLPIRSPLLVAEEVAVLDRLSGGRVILGLGRGFRRALFTTFGVAPAEKRSRFEAALETMRAAWRGEPVALVEGKDGESEPVLLEPRPVQRPHPPLWVAAFGPKALVQAGSLDLPYLSSPLETLERLVENYRIHGEARPSHSVDPLPVPVMRTVFVSDDAGERAIVERALEGESERWRRLRREAAEPGGPTSAFDWALVGEPRDLPRLVEPYVSRLGLTHLIVRAPVPGAEPAALERSLRAIPQSLGGRSGSVEDPLTRPGEP